MDRRLSLVAAFGVALGGCVPSSTVSSTSKTTPKISTADKTTAVEMAASAIDRRKPKSATYVQLGQVQEQWAADPKCKQQQKEEYLDTARKAYQQALEEDPKNLPAIIALSRLYAQRGDYARAAASYEKATKEHPKMADVWYEAGMCHARFKKWDPAIRNLRKAVEFDDENRKYNNALGFTLARANRFEESFEAFKKVNPEPEAHMNLARMLRHLDQIDLCKQHVSEALQLDPNHAGARRLLADLEQPVTEATVPVSHTEPEAEINN